MNEHILIADECQRLDKWLGTELEEFSRTNIQRLILGGHVLVDGRTVQKNYKLTAGQTVTVTPPPLVPSEIVPQNIPLDIVFEDEHLLVVNKAKGMVVHPAPGNPDGTLVNALLYHCRGTLSGINGDERPGIVHRIDKDTSGLLVVAKSDTAHAGLSEQIAAHTVTRRYSAVIHGTLKPTDGTVNAPIGRDAAHRKRQAAMAGGRHAVTHYTTIERLKGFSYIELRLETGRTHQIRVHMSMLGHPVAGDTLYGSRGTPDYLGGQCLHAERLGFIHPVTGEDMQFFTPLPSYFTRFLDEVKENT